MVARALLSATLLWIASGCGLDAELVVELRTLASEDPYASLQTLHISLERDRADNVVAEQSFAAADRMSLEPVEPGGVVRILVRGYAAPTLAPALATGRSAWVAPAPGATTTVGVCFCLTDTVDAGLCRCD